MIVTVTGHRPPRLKGQEEKIKEWIKEQLELLKPSEMYNGMATGVDQIAALVAKEMNIPIVCCYPWSREELHPVEEYILDGNKKVVVSDKYSKQAYFFRDKYMVDHADTVLTVWDGVPKGGTYITREYAKKTNKTVIDYKGLYT